MKLQRAVQALRDDQGHYIKVALGPAARHHCVLDQSDWNLLLDSGFSPNCHYITNPRGQVYATVTKSDRRGGHEILARVLMDARADEQVTYIDGDTLNLRRANLLKKEITKRMDNSKVTGLDNPKDMKFKDEPEVSRGRELGPYIVKCYLPGGPWWRVATRTDGKEIPAVLKGSYTSLTDIENAVRVSLNGETGNDENS